MCRVQWKRVILGGTGLEPAHLSEWAIKRPEGRQGNEWNVIISDATFKYSFLLILSNRANWFYFSASFGRAKHFSQRKTTPSLYNLTPRVYIITIPPTRNDKTYCKRSMGTIDQWWPWPKLLIFADSWFYNTRFNSDLTAKNALFLL
jgi:hypothetical protein